MAAGPQITNIPPPASFNILFNNVQSLRRRLVTGELEAEWNDYPILCLSETWLNPNIFSEDLQLTGYALPERRDRLTDGYGGLCMYFRNDLPHNRRNDLETENIELMWCVVFAKGGKFLLGNLYRPPNSTTTFWDAVERQFNARIEAKARVPDLEWRTQYI